MDCSSRLFHAASDVLACAGRLASARFTPAVRRLDERRGLAMPRLSGKIALITGGGTGIGRACALAFAADGAKVAIAGRRKQSLDAVAREIEASGGNALVVECDVVSRTAVQDAIAAVVRHFSGLDILVN